MAMAMPLVGFSSAITQTPSQKTNVEGRPAQPPLDIVGSYEVWNAGPGWLIVTVYAKNNGTKPISFHLNLPCTSEIKLYQDPAHTGVPIHFLPGSALGEGNADIPTGYVDVTLAPKQSHREECGQFNMEKLVRDDGGPVVPDIYYPVIRLSQPDSLLINSSSPMVAVGSYARDTVRVGPLRITGKIRIEGRGIWPIFTILSDSIFDINDIGKFVDIADARQDVCRPRLALYQNQSHAGRPFRYTNPKWTLHWAGRVSVPLGAHEIVTTTCSDRSVPIDELMRDGQRIISGVYYATYDIVYDYKSGKATTLDLGKIVIP